MDNQALVKMIQNLTEKIDAMQKNEFHIHIEKVTVDHLQLDELAYHLDKIDIKELSGMMNLGNSFSPNLETVKSQSKSPQYKNEKNDSKEKPNSHSKPLKKDEPVLSVNINGKEILLD
ncbi:hypothetical protein J7E38_10530 [Bacillus sp. ISL-35]|uniref:hypothetical protein n=1 Tax=Bacillus sp. ISL-35 TaxID=2819122 RepID=UPI001BE6B060|nr:hypothetical protein [Bacillus sp. ISL-35]MBT2679438.1 hypothetical protein [Bacillus sp. ISL-35]MBT2703341.1 hypothetical protein [Chryseobacterium sp. ISL-80]